MKSLWIFVGIMTCLGSAVTGLSAALGAPAPPAPVVTDDTAIYQRLSEIKADRAGRPDFDADIEHLSNIKSAYRERLPSLSRNGQRAGRVGDRLSAPMKRISSKPYRYSGTRHKRVSRD
jgi:hypothetical protein